MRLSLKLIPVAALLIYFVSVLFSSQGPPRPRGALSARTRNISGRFRHKSQSAAPPRVWCNSSNKTLRIIAAGLGRSGSTWQFNVLVSALWLAGMHPMSTHGQLSSSFSYLNATLHCPVSVVKVHQFHPELLAYADYVFTSHRDPRDALISMIDIGNPTGWTEYWQEYLRWAAFACYDMVYEEMYDDPLREIKRMLDVLQLPKEVTPERVQHVVNFRFNDSNKINGSVWDSRTGYYKAHIRDPAPGRWRKNITHHAEDLIRLEKVTYQWMRSKGYTPYFPTSVSVKAKSKTVVGSFETTLEPPAVNFVKADLCPLSAAAHNIGAAMPAGTRTLQWKQPDNFCNEIPLICDHPFAFFLITLAIFLVLFFVLFLGCYRLVLYYFPHLPETSRVAVQHRPPRVSD